MYLARLRQRMWLRMADEGGGPAGESEADPAGGGEAGDGAAAAEPSIADLASQTLDEMRAGEPGRPDSTLAAPDAAAPPVPAPAEAPPAGQVPSPAPAGGIDPQAQQLLQQFGLGNVPPEVAQVLAPKLGEMTQWAQQMQSAYAQVSGQNQQMMAWIQQAQQQFAGGQAPAGQTPGQPPNAQPPEFESPGEQYLHQQYQQVHGVIDGLRGQLDQVTQQLSHVLEQSQGQQQVMQQQETNRFHGEIVAAEQHLVGRYPALADGDGQLKQDVFRMAKHLFEAQTLAAQQAGQPVPQVGQVLEQACKLLDYDNVAARTQQQTVRTLRDNSRRHTLPGVGRGGAAPEPQTLAEIAAAEFEKRTQR